jgi:hypothetical protein
MTNARLLRSPQLGIFLRSFPLHSLVLCAENDRRKLLELAGCCARSARSQAVRGSPRGQPVRRMRRTPRYGDH